MARLLLLCLAALAFAVSPASVSAAGADCARAMAQPMAAMDGGSSMTGDHKQIAKPPCCNHAAKACAKACAAMSAAAALTPARLDGLTVFTTLASSDPARSLFSPSREPSGFDPPPRQSLA